MSEPISELARRLAAQAEAVCRHYLPNGRREGRYWMVGDIHNTPGRSLFVRLHGAESGKGAAGKWTDAATGDHGDLLDIIRARCGLHDFRDVVDEARRFLSLPTPERTARMRSADHRQWRPVHRNQLNAYSQCRSRFRAHAQKRICANAGLRLCTEPTTSVFIRAATIGLTGTAPTETWPAMIAAVTDLSGAITGAHRTWLDPTGDRKAPVDTPRRAMGHLLGHAVRFDVAHDVLAAGEGIETMLSLRCVLPSMPMVAALSAAHLAAILFPATLRRLYVARDDDPAGDAAVANLIDRTQEAGIEAITLSPRLGDFNEDLRTLGIDALRAAIRVQIVPEDVARFMNIAAARRTGG